MSKVDPGVLAHLINFPAESQVRSEIFADPSSPPSYFLLSLQAPSLQGFYPDLLFHDSPLHLGQMTS